MRLQGKAAIVTGAGSGIGKAIALAMAKEGSDIIIAERNEKTGKEVAQTFSKMGRRSLFIKTDVGLEEDVVRMVKEARKFAGRLDILVNNAGIILQAKVVDTTSEGWDLVLRNNLKSCFLCSREVAKVMIADKTQGAIVNISSIHATLSEPQAGAYTAAKGGMEAFSRTLATELAPYKIRVNCIEPGATYTELTIPMYTEPVKNALYQRIPLKEIAKPEWIASGAVFLASEEACYITGHVLVIDGGYVMDGSLPGAAYWTE